MAPLLILLAALLTPPTPVKVITRDNVNAALRAGGIEIFVLSPAGISLRIGVTDADGVLTAELGCVQGAQVFATDTVQQEYLNGKANCLVGASTIEIPLQRKRRQQLLEENANTLLKKEDWYKAALAYNELSFVIVSDAEVKAGYDRRLYEALGKKLGVERPWSVDRETGTVVMTPALKERVKGLQKELGLKETGIVDYSTLSKAAGTNINSLLFRPIPCCAPER